ncbi:hypothetical protein AYI70_g4325 [Smittium culicis]|uniref:Chitin-binding type-4 domain-containing protein n=1 Tax=Smittium culicis TaxID=133412 RepID=A0A1R1XZP8_9FUNG|nr:hypothetical protein AYI70_g4325 [Smittium culicis]
MLRFINKLAGLVLLIVQLKEVLSHGMLKYPYSRGNLKWFGTCGAGAGCKGPCDSSIAESKGSLPFRLSKMGPFKRGSSIQVQWNRLNHPGGFVRLAIVPYKSSDSWRAFDRNVVQFNCYESNCGPTVKNDPILGYLNGSGDMPCSKSLEIPTNLADGLYTLQWAWFGGGVYISQVDKSFGEYYGCSDFVVKGGPPPVSFRKPTVFKGGDVMYPNQQVCRYWGSNRLGDCNFAGRYPVVVPGNPYASTLEPCMSGGAKKGRPLF